MNSAALAGAIRAHGAMAAGQAAATKTGEVSAYNPAAFSIKVAFPPDETETGWIPLGSPWVGNGWGMFCAPSLGDQVEVDFQDGSQNAPITGMRFFDAQNQPLSAPSGEFWLVHKSGAFFKLTNAGGLNLSDGNGASLTLDGQGNIVTAGNWRHTGRINANGHYIDEKHTHGGVATGGGTSGIVNT